MTNLVRNLDLGLTHDIGERINLYAKACTIEIHPDTVGKTYHLTRAPLADLSRPEYLECYWDATDLANLVTAADQVFYFDDILVDYNGPQFTSLQYVRRPKYFGYTKDTLGTVSKSNPPGAFKTLTPIPTAVTFSEPLTLHYRRWTQTGPGFTWVPAAWDTVAINAEFALDLWGITDGRARRQFQMSLRPIITPYGWNVDINLSSLLQQATVVTKAYHPSNHFSGVGPTMNSNFPEPFAGSSTYPATIYNGISDVEGYLWFANYTLDQMYLGEFSTTRLNTIASNPVAIGLLDIDIGGYRYSDVFFPIRWTGLSVAQDSSNLSCTV